MVDTVRPGNSLATVTSRVVSVTTPTSIGPFCGGGLSPQAVMARQSASKERDRTGNGANIGGWVSFLTRRSLAMRLSRRFCLPGAQGEGGAR